MPLYEFHCGDCNVDFEGLIFSAEDHSAVTCPGFNSTNTEKTGISNFSSLGGGCSSGDCSGCSGSC